MLEVKSFDPTPRFRQIRDLSTPVMIYVVSLREAQIVRHADSEHSNEPHRGTGRGVRKQRTQRVSVRSGSLAEYYDACPHFGSALRMKNGRL